jgi:hypothetical protein
LLRIVSVENYSVQDDCDALQNDLNDTANKRPILFPVRHDYEQSSDETNLKSANQCIIYFFLKEFSSLVIDTRPTPNVFVVAVAFCSLENTGCYTPHDGAKDEVSNSKQSVIDSNFFRSAMTTSPIIPKHHET